MDISWIGYTLSEILINFMKAFGPLGLAIAAFSSEVGGTIKKGLGAVAMVPPPAVKAGAVVAKGAAVTSYAGASIAREQLSKLRAHNVKTKGGEVGNG